MLHVGYKHYIKKDKVLAIVKVGSAPISRLRQNVDIKDKLVNCTNGSRASSLVFLTDGYVVASANTTETLKKRMEGEYEG